MRGKHSRRKKELMAEVVIAGVWKGEIVGIDRYLSEEREKTKKLFDTGWERIEKNHGKVSQSYLDQLYEAYENLKQLDQALEGRFNIIIVVTKQKWGAWII